MPRQHPEFAQMHGADPIAPAAASRPNTLVWGLGLAGLIPFVLGAALQFLPQPGWRMLASMALLSYGAVIVSFLGGIHWGLAMRSGEAAPARLIWGVLPSLLGWLAVLLDRPWGLILLALSLLACWWVDRAVYRRLGLGAWLPLRTVLTTVATLSVAVAAAAYWQL